MQVKYKKCNNCDYKNSIEVDSCVICGNKDFKIINLKKNKYIFYFYLFLLVVIIVLYINVRKGDEKIQNSPQNNIPVFVSEKRPINYYTYLYSIRFLSKTKPDEHDKEVVLRALKCEDEHIKKEAGKVIDIWNKKYGVILTTFTASTTTSFITYQ